jgi:cytochrome P450
MARRGDAAVIPRRWSLAAVRWLRGAAEPLEDALGRVLALLARPAFAVLRRVRPILVVKDVAVVTRAADVRAVLADHEHFRVLYEPKMTAITGPFILGLEDGALYRHDEAALRAAVRAEDVPGIGEAMLAAARERMAAADGAIDVVSELADPSIYRVMSGYFGTWGPARVTQVRWARSLFQEIFINVADNPAVRERALGDAAGMREHLDAVIAARRWAIAAGQDVPDDVLGRLMRVPPPDGLHDLAIRHNLIGLMVGWVPTVSTAFALAVEELLHREDELAGAQDAARAGDRDRVAEYVFEALRFRPQNWALLRRCTGPGAGGWTVGAGTPRATRMPEGTTIYAATQSAMFDRDAVEAPGEFRRGRAPSAYMHFGHGLHTCFGEAINRVQLPALAMALLEHERPIRRTPGDAGKLRRRGPYPAGLRVSL